jgi:regulator of cell morphogenesis and NO signaling
MPTTTLDLDCGATVNETIARWPATLAVFKRFGIDTCCGGAVSVEEAARRNNADAQALCDSLRSSLRSA